MIAAWISWSVSARGFLQQPGADRGKVETRKMSSAETGRMRAIEAGQMAAAEIGHMSAVETRQMATVETGLWLVSIFYICWPLAGNGFVFVEIG